MYRTGRPPIEVITVPSTSKPVNPNEITNMPQVSELMKKFLLQSTTTGDEKKILCAVIGTTPAAIVRTDVDGPPRTGTGSDCIILSGITGEEYAVTNANGTTLLPDEYPTWVNNGSNQNPWDLAKIYQDSTDWVIRVTDISGLEYYKATKAIGETTNPFGLTGWTIVTGSGQPVLTTTPDNGTVGSVGQFCFYDTDHIFQCVATDPVNLWIELAKAVY